MAIVVKVLSILGLIQVSSKGVWSTVHTTKENHTAVQQANAWTMAPILVAACALCRSESIAEYTHIVIHLCLAFATPLL